MVNLGLDLIFSASIVAKLFVVYAGTTGSRGSVEMIVPGCGAIVWRGVVIRPYEFFTCGVAICIYVYIRLYINHNHELVYILVYNQQKLISKNNI